MEHIKEVELDKNDMKIVLNFLGVAYINEIIKQSEYVNEYPKEIKEEDALYFLKNHLDIITKKGVRKKFYKKLNDKIVKIDLKLLEANIHYDIILAGKNLIDLRSLFEKAQLDISEMKAIPILLKCLNIEYTKSIAFAVENELYIRSRIKNEVNKKDAESTDYINKINRLTLELKEYGLNIKNKSERIAALEQIIKDLEFELTQYNPDIGYYSELTQTDYVKIIEDLGKHSSKIKEKFKQLIQKFEEDENEPEYKLYEMWMEWTDEEVTILDSVLKKSMYEEVIKRTDLNDLEYISENIMNRYLLSRLLLHFIYRRMSSQCWEEVLG